MGRTRRRVIRRTGIKHPKNAKKSYKSREQRFCKMKENWCELYVGKKDALWKNRKFPERNRDK